MSVDNLMNQIKDLSFVSLEDRDADWVGLCAAAALLMNKWQIVRNDPSDLLPTGTIDVAGSTLEAEFWWSDRADAVQRVLPKTASHLVISVRPVGTMPVPRSLMDDLRSRLAKDIDKLKFGTVADLPFDAGPD